MMLSTTLVLISTIYFPALEAADIASCSEGECYQRVNTSSNNLTDRIDRFNSTVSTAKVPQLLDLTQLKKDAQNLENRTKKLQTQTEKSHRKLNQSQKNITKEQKTVDRNLELLTNLTEYKQTSDTILKNAQEKESKLLEGSETCQKALDESTKLKNMIDEIAKDFNNVTKFYNDTKDKVEEANRDLRNLFLDTFKIRDEFNETMRYFRNNADRLKALLEDIQKLENDELTSQFEKVQNNVAKVDGDVQDMNADLDQYEAALTGNNFKPTVDKTSRILLDEIKKNLYDLEARFDYLDLPEEELQQWIEEQKKDKKDLKDLRNRLLKLKEYNKFLEAVPVKEEQVASVKEETKKLKDTIGVILRWKELKEQQESLRTTLENLYDEQFITEACKAPPGSNV